ncbi:MAG: riboflavin synthase [Steroidobacterales bacterium]
MFTGIIQDVGRVLAIEERRGEPANSAGDLRVKIGVDSLDLSRQKIGDSIAAAGVCLTVVELGPQFFSADVSRETLRITTVGSWRVGKRVNLEPALRAGDALGGHLVIGHVDGVAKLLSRTSDARSERWRLRAPLELARYVARKGSIALDGVSLTVNGVDGDGFDVNLVPHTLTVTALGDSQAGDLLNLEVDLIARYVERLLMEKGE